MKSVLVDYLIGAGIKPRAIVSYNHLGNNDGYNLISPATFRSKEISKSNVVDDMVASNEILYKPGEHPDHVVVIKYVPYVGDSKRPMDEYTSEISMARIPCSLLDNKKVFQIIRRPPPKRKLFCYAYRLAFNQIYVFYGNCSPNLVYPVFDVIPHRLGITA